MVIKHSQCTEENPTSWGDCSVDKNERPAEWEPYNLNSNANYPCKKPGMAVCAYNYNMGGRDGLIPRAHWIAILPGRDKLQVQCDCDREW